MPVPFDRLGRLHREAEERYVRYMAGQPIDGVAVWAHTGRGLYLEEGLADEVLDSWRRGIGPGRLLIAGAGARLGFEEAADPAAREAYIHNALRMAERARRGAADAILVHPPRLFRDLPGRRRWIGEYYQALAGAGLPLIAFYLYQEAGGVSFTFEELGDLFSLPAVAAIKIATLDSVCTFQNVVNFVRKEFPHLAVLTGEDRFLGYSLLSGAAGALIGMGAALPGFHKRLVEACLHGPAEEAIRLTLLADRFAERTFIPPMEGTIRRMLHALFVLGVIPEEAAEDPWHPPIPDREKEAIEVTVGEIVRTEGGP
ncbi:MAG: dihydrodipicolinate synthase family protein [Planctomycetes bacterium]|nr:dihydrodipicolinate synthase family protein [Planctomycetota bacterium]